MIFRADASVQIGTGHVMRCLTLAEELRRQGHQCVFICRDHVGHLADLVTQKAFDLHLLRSPEQSEMLAKDEPAPPHSYWLGVPWQTDAKQTLEVLSGCNADWLIVDHYALDAQWERQLAQGVGQVMVIDDLADREHQCAVLLDQNLGRQLSDYDGFVPRNAIRLIGPHYAILRPEFRHLREKSLQRRDSITLKRILISLGGVDRTNVTGRVLAALAETPLPPDIELDIVMGSAAPALAQVKAQAARLSCQATVSVNVSDMAQRMCLADLSIGAAGSTSWERCCLGLPAIMIILADNQRLIGEVLARSGAALLVEEARVEEDLGLLVRRYVESAADLRKFAQNAAEVCDGDGTTRVVSTMTGEVVWR